ncbi:MAG: ATP-binding protein [Dehalobacterium sp.]|jgi:DNA polymerase-3 subunit delta'
MLPQLQQAVKSDLMVHAYLFLGPREKTIENALGLAQAVNCLSSLDGRGCGECLSCRKIKHGNHPDVMVIEPLGTSFKIEQGRELHKLINYRHYEGRYKVLILTGGDIMTSAAANSMLKMLEEPPERTIFILLAENGDNILPTVLSRCQVIKFGDETEKISEDGAVQEEYIDQVIALVQDLPQMDYAQLLKISETWEKNKEDIPGLLEGMLTWFRDIGVAKLTREESMVHNKKHWDLLVTSPLSADQAFEAAQEVARSQQLLRQNVYHKLVLDVLFLKIQVYFQAGSEE